MLLFLTTSCISQEDNQIIDDEIVLKIESFEISRYEYEKTRRRDLENQNKSNAEDWLNNYIANSYFLTDAYLNKYDTISAIIKKVNYAATTMLSQYKGYLWNKVEEPKIVFSRKELKRVYRKRNNLFDLEFFLFPDETTIKTILNNDTCINTEADFKMLALKCKENTIKCANAQLLYPFSSLEPAKKQIYKSKQGSIIRKSFKDGKILIAHLKKVTKRNQKKFKEEKAHISSVLRRIKENQIIADKRNSVFNEANIRFNEDVVDSIFEKVVNTPPPVEVSKQMLADTVLTYLFNNQINELLLADFIDYYNNHPFVLAIINKNTLYEVLNNIVEEMYLYVESEKLGITNEKLFLLDKRDYMNRLILNAYSKNNFYSTKVADIDIYDYYINNKQRFSQSKTCYVSVFTFRDKNLSAINLNLVNKIISQGGIKNPSDTSKMGLLYYHPNDKIETNSDKYPNSIIRNIFLSKVNVLIGPIVLNNHANIFVKIKEEGQEIQPFELVRESIKKLILTERGEILKDNKLDELISKYPVTINKIQQNE